MSNEEPLLPPDIVAEAANNSPIVILGKTKLFIQVNDAHKSNHEFHVASEMLSEVILGLDWLVNNQVVIDTANMLMKFPDSKCQPLLVFDAALKDAYPLPQVNNLIDTLSGHKYFTTLDLASGYWQVPMEESSQEKTAFVIPGGNIFHFKRLPFGLCNAVPTFQRLMANVLQGLLPNKCLIYLDDVLIVGHNFEEHLNNLKEVLNAIQNAGLKLKPSKCHFGQRSVKFLGFQIADTGLAPDPEKVKAIKEYPVPKDLTELRRFIGMISYYRHFISGFSDIAHPLHRLLQKDAKFEWNQSCQNSFESLKEQLISSPILGFPDTDKDYVLYTDASDVGIGAVLTQEDENGTERVISFASKAFSGSEKNWTTTEKEAFAVVWALQYFHPYVYGRHVTVFTDHRALQWLKAMKHPNGKLAR